MNQLISIASTKLASNISDIQDVSTQFYVAALKKNNQTYWTLDFKLNYHYHGYNNRKQKKKLATHIP